MKNVNQGGVQLTDEEKENLLAFIKTLTDTTFINNPDFSNPF
jgi:cytochrome c peroxidase